MSEQNDSPDQNQPDNKDGGLDLSSLNFGPAWARGESDREKKPRFKDYDSDKKKGGPRRGSGGSRGGSRGSSQGPRDNRRNGSDRHSGGRPQGGNRNNDRRQQGRNNRYEQRDPLPLPEGYCATVMPVEAGLDQLAKEIRSGGRTYSVFDLAKMVLKSRERYNLKFTTEKGSDKQLFSCQQDGSVWMTREEALNHATKSPWIDNYYEKIEVEGDAPSGNYTSIARCGLSGKIIGPPNHHDYQPTIARIHRENFAHMDLERYKSKVRVEQGEDIVNEWIEAMKISIQYRPLSSAEIEAKLKALKDDKTAEEAAKTNAPEESKEASQAKKKEETTPAEPVVTEAPPEEASSETPETPAETSNDESKTEESSTAENTETAEKDPAEAEAAETSKEEAPASEKAENTPENAPDSENLKDDKALRAHYLEHHFKDSFKASGLAFASGGIPKGNLSPGLFNLLLETTQKERRHPGGLASILCRQFSGRHLAVFKFKKLLKVGPSRPHAIPEGEAIADRPQQIIDWVSKNNGKQLDQLWKELFPENISDEDKKAWYHDLHWLLNQGFLLLFSNNTLNIGKTAPPPQQPATKKTAEKKEDTKTAETSTPDKNVEKTTEEPTKPPAETPKAEKEE